MYYSTSFFFFVSFFIIFFTKGLTILSSNGVEAATVAITAVLTSCGGFGMYCSMNLVRLHTRVIHSIPSSLLSCPITRSSLNSLR